MKPCQVTPGQQAARLQALARHFGLKEKEMCELVMDAGLTAIESRLDQNGYSQLAAISQQQRVVLDLLQQGKTVKEIAYQLSLAEPTIRTHITRIKEKLNCSDLLNLRMNHLSH